MGGWREGGVSGRRERGRSEWEEGEGGVSGKREEGEEEGEGGVSGRREREK